MPALSDLMYGSIAGTRIQAKDLDTTFALPVGSQTANTRTKRERAALGTVATTGASETLLVAPCNGTITEMVFVSHDGLAANDTNFLTLAAVNKGAAGAGSTAILASTPTGTNTTKVTGGAAITAYVPFSLVLSGTPANLTVNKNDVISLTATATGTLSGTLTLSMVTVGFLPST